MQADVIIIGAGLAGLTCAVRLKQQGVNALVLDAADDVGGKIRTDTHEGFLFDRGFQVLLTAYPEARRFLDFAALDLVGFHSGAIVHTAGGISRLGDPFRHPGDLLPTLFAHVGTLWDKFSVLRLRAHVCGPPLSAVLTRPETTTHERLRQLGFSREIIERFFRPFLGGIFLENDLITSSRKFEFVFRMFSSGLAALPAAGMQAIPRQLAAHLSPEQLRLNETVTKITESGVKLASGETISARQIAVATDAWSAAKLLARDVSTPPAEVACLYFAAEVSPVKGRWLVLNGDGAGPINNLTVPSDLQSCYAPPGQSLISVTVLDQSYLGRDSLVSDVRAQLLAWFGRDVNQWRYLRSYFIPCAVAVQAPPALSPVDRPARMRKSIVECGDYTDIVSIEGAIKSGLRAAQAIVDQKQ